MASDREIFAGLDEMSGLGLALERKRRAQAAMLALMGLATPQKDDDDRKKWKKPRQPAASGAQPVPRPRQTPRAPTASSLLAPRANDQVKQGLALKSQSAVVKLASYASGASRLGALTSYLSHQGEIALEREDGSKVQGIGEVRGLALQWAEDAPEREPSKDILMFHVEVKGQKDREAIGASLAEALSGHKFAWRSEQTAEGVHIEVATVAASSQKNASGKAERLYATQKSLSGLERRLDTAFGAETSFEDRGWSHGVEGAARYLSRLTRDGQQEAQLSTGKVLSGHQANLAVAKEWKRSMRSREQRDCAHVILSVRPGTDKEAFVAAARATLHRAFEGHEFVFAMHENRQHLHVHAVVKMEAKTGERMHPGIADFTRWRQTLAEEARERSILMESTSRFESANVPGYKLKDIRQVERGIAPENVRRRVEAVQTNAVHVPTRAEGRERARAVAGEWQALAPQLAGDAAPRREPPIGAGMTRLYRFEPAGAPASSAPLFTSQRSVAESMAGEGRGDLTYIDVPRSRLSELTASRKNPERDFVVPAVFAQTSKPLGTYPGAIVLHLRTRTLQAVARIEALERAQTTERAKPSEKVMLDILHNDKYHINVDDNAPTTASVGPPTSKEARPMPDAQTMEMTRNDLRKQLDRIVAATPVEHRDRMRVISNKVADNWDTGIEQQKKIERQMGSVQGDHYVEPRQKAFDNFTAYVPEQRGQTVRYAHKLDNGSAGQVAFRDNGRRIEVDDWRHKEATLAALQLASEKWEAITVKGPPRYQNMVVSLAAEHGFKIANRELQDRVEEERARLQVQRTQQQDQRPSLSEGTTPLQVPDPAQAERRAGDAYTEVSAYRTEAVKQFMDVVRQARHGEGVAGNQFEKPEAAEVAIAVARQQALNSLAESDRHQFAVVSSRFVEANNGISHERLDAAEERVRRGEETVPADALALGGQQRAPSGAAPAQQVRKAQDANAGPQPESITGEFVGQGTSPYKGERNATPSPHADIRTENGTMRVWGVNIPEAINKAEVDPGDRITLAISSRERVQKDVRFKDEQTGQWKTETRDVWRNNWSAEVHEKAREGEDPGQTQAQAPAQAQAIGEAPAIRSQTEVSQRDGAAQVQPVGGRTETERQAELRIIAEQTKREAVRETVQAHVSEVRHETPADPGYRSEGQAASARAAERAVEESPAASIPVTPETSPEIEQLAERQEAVKQESALAQAETQAAERQRPRAQRM
ncbi:hypothetical protein GCM10007874_31290 [Labrys miyagiensis]|uniref:Relaxase/Mobilisation nuclease domain-containing protein n=1 Tax=Labrys miyagiensis TaxID=346912 RepID=A0ABQ6CPF2_9HYPH|nr:LPD7 domain-containing protein [Labrys miyagiensis]GLS20112.1 hypothetical protein GCM10007874_31290 [Labrys miyagiensis]